MAETPTIAAVAYRSSTAPIGQMAMLDQMSQSFAPAYRHPHETFDAGVMRSRDEEVLRKQLGLRHVPPTERYIMRIVRVFIADINESLPLEKRILYRGEEQLTDLTDQELYFEVDIKPLVEAHNAVRVATRNKDIKDRVENLEPVRIKDLRMTVVEIAKF